MGRIAFLVALLLLPAIAAADGMATAICVLPKATYAELVKKHGTAAKIPTDVLWRSAAHM